MGELEVLKVLDPNIAATFGIGITDTFIRLGVSLALGLILSLVVRKYTPTSSQGGVPILIGLLTFIGASLVVIIGGSVVLTLGLVGGLSAVRFRTAIKEPVDIAFIFISLIIGIGTGAGFLLHGVIVTVLFCVAFIWYSLLIRQQTMFRVRLEIYKVNVKELKDLIRTCKGVTIHKKQDGALKDGQETIYMEFDILETPKNQVMLSTVSDLESIISFSYSELQRIEV